MLEASLFWRGLFLSDYAAARMAAVARDLSYILVGSVLTMVAAVLLLAANRTRASLVSTSVVVVRHKKSPMIELNFVATMDEARLNIRL